MQDPPADIKLSVTAEVEGHNLNHLAKFIEMQVRQYAVVGTAGVMLSAMLLYPCHCRYTEPFIRSILFPAERHGLSLFFPAKYLILMEQK